MATAAFDEQKRLGEQIHTLKVNYGKDGQNRKNSTEYFGKKLDSLKLLFDEFEENHKQLEVAFANEVQPHEYFTNNYFTGIREIYTSTIAKIEADLKTFTDSLTLSEDDIRAECVELTANKDFTKRMLHLLHERIQKCSNLDLKTWKFNLARADRYWDEFEKYGAKLASLNTPLYSQANFLEERNELHDVHQAIAVLTEQKISTAEIDEPEFGEPDLNQTLLLLNKSLTSRSHEPYGRKENDDFKLPRVQIPKFDGTLSRWPEFRDLYSALVHSKAKLPKVQKMQYLKSILEKDAADIIRHLHITELNYDTAWALIEKRYNNKKMLVTNYFNRLFNQPAIQSDQSDALKKLLDNTKEILMSLKQLGEPTESWGSIIVFVLTQRMPPNTFRLWEESCDEEISNVEKVEKFIETRFRTLENLELKKSLNKEKQSQNAPQFTGNKKPTNQTGNPAKSFSVSVTISCNICKKSHNTLKCFKFKNATPDERHEFVKQLKLCALCLGNHSVNKCPTSWKCYTCQGKHNTSLHVDAKAITNSADVSSDVIPDAECNVCVNPSHSSVMLATALIKINNMTLRALIDQGSTVSFIAEKASQALNLKRQNEKLCVAGVAGTTNANINGSVLVKIKPHFPSNFEYTVKAYILNKITSIIPSDHIELNVGAFGKLQLADPTLNKPHGIDLLLGADVLSAIMLDGVIRGQPLAQETTLGWIVSGKTSKASQNANACFSITLDEQVERFWELEEMHDLMTWRTVEGTIAEELYQQTQSIDPSTGRYMVRLPFKANREPLGRSRNIAVANLLQLEKKFKKNPTYKNKYVLAMSEYFTKGFASPAIHPENFYLRKTGETNCYNCFYMPHLAVMKETSASTKTRIVFDASRKSMNGTSLNDILLTGPTIQDDIITKLLNFRKHRYVFTADAEKMYLQILVHPSDRPYQRFVWREEDSMEIKDYCINTVVFGQSSAPFLAIRTFKQIALDHKESHPAGAKALDTDFYVDDLLAGDDSIEMATKKKNELIIILGKAGIKLRKWASNEAKIIADIPQEDLEPGSAVNIDAEKTVKTLGLYWNVTDDSFRYKTNFLDESGRVFSKRQILSESAKLFDPIGWLQPIIISAKILLQELWTLKIGWDDKLESTFNDRWLKYKLDLQNVAKINVPRWLGIMELETNFELHVFADASEKAYGAVAYLKNNANQTAHILMAKSRVAPLKKKTLPRLELCAALVAVNIIRKIRCTLRVHDDNIFGWSDSTITLAWIGKPSSTWGTFVSHRVAQIQEEIKSARWNHVKSAENPADLISRGCGVETLRLSSLWWHGPAWLPTWAPTEVESFDTQEEMKKPKAISLNTCPLPVKVDREIENLMSKLSSFNRLIGTVAWVLRAKNIFKNPKYKSHISRELALEELRQAQRLVIKTVQNDAFGPDMTRIQDKDLPNTSKLRLLDPWIDADGFLRLGGRLDNADMPFEQKHPLIMPDKHELTTLIIRNAHKECMHAGNKLTLATIRQKYWIIRGNSAVKMELRNCTVCKRWRASTNIQLMGQLPSARVNAHNPFAHTGCDLAGPISIKSARGRGIRTTKGYIVLFVCMATKAIHIELASDLSSASFIASLKRFISRRGHISDLYSDNGSNFIGANRILIRENMQNDSDIQSFVKGKNIQWHFLPAYSPHMGGLWEAGVKSIKHHLNRTLDGQKLTLEEMNTVLCQIESCLNSRPLVPISEEIDNLDILTPGHFLIGRPLTAPAEQSYIDSNPNHLSRWQHCSRLSQVFWSKWRNEYLNELRQRVKWTQTKRNMATGDIVLIKEDNIPPNQWRMGRVTETHAGTDGLTRAVSLKTERGTVKRNITKLVSLVHQEAVVDPNPAVDNATSAASPNFDPQNLTPRQVRYESRNKKREVHSKPVLSSNVILSVLALTFLVSMVAGTAIKINKLNEQTPSIYFDEIGTVQYIKNYWKVSIRHNRSLYDQELMHAFNSVAAISSICQNVNQAFPSCKKKTRNLQNKVTQITNRAAYINVSTPARKKREILITMGAMAVGTAVGIGGKYLYDRYFGQDDQLNQIFLNEEILKNHLETENSILNDTLHVFEAEHATTNANLHELFRTANNDANDIEKIWIRQKFVFLLYELTYQLDELLTFQDKILNPRNHAMEIFTAAHVQEVIQRVSTHTQPDESLPTYRSLHDLMIAAAISTHMTDNVIEFIMKIPLVGKYGSRVYQKHLIPVVNGPGEMVVIQDANEYYTIDLVNSTSSLTDIHFGQCIQLATYICPADLKNVESNACDNAWFFNPRQGTNDCDIANINATAFWAITKHGMIFSLPNETTVSVICRNVTVEVHLPAVGVINPGDCEVQSNNVTLKRGEELNPSNIQFPIRTPKLKIKQIKHVHQIKATEADETIKNIENRIENLHDKQSKMSLYHAQHYVAQYVLIAIVVLGLYLANRKTKPGKITHPNFVISEV